MDIRNVAIIAHVDHGKTTLVDQALFGAPFWFNALQTFVRLKGAGPSLGEKATGQAAAA